MLLGAGVISFTLWYILDNAEGPGWIDGVAILSAVVVVVAVSATTNFQRDAQFSELAAAERDVKVRVRRGGRELSLSVNDLVVGDILLVESGDILPGDGVLLEGYDVRTDESHLTGEAGEKTKSVGGDPRVFSGSRVLSGFGLVALLAVGVNSQQGKIFEMTQGRGGGVDAADQTQCAPTPMLCACDALRMGCLAHHALRMKCFARNALHVMLWRDALRISAPMTHSGRLSAAYYSAAYIGAP